VTWRTDLAAATAEAKAAGKDVLVEFTTRDAAAGAPAIDAAVYNDARFLRAAEEWFVPVRLTVRTGDSDTPPDVEIVGLAERWSVSRVPSLVLTDAVGRPYAAVEGEAETVEAQIAAVNGGAGERARRDEAFTHAEQATGAERAARLHDALRHVGRFAVAAYEPAVAEIVSLDPRNALGLEEQYAGALAVKRIDRAIQQKVYPLIDRADFAGAIAAIDQIVAGEDPPVAQSQTLLAFKGQLLYSTGRKDEGRRLLEQALAMAPAGPNAQQVAAARRQMDE
jgi:hypothetical protein